jgi:hypothetical protein
MMFCERSQNTLNRAKPGDGMNDLTSYTHAVWLTAMKPSPHEITILEKVFGITADEIIRAREHEAIHQFVNRSNLRDPTSTQPVSIYLFSEKQAKAAQEMMGGGLVQHIPIGLPRRSKKQDEKPNKGGRPPKYATPEEAKAAKAASDRRSYERKLAKKNASQGVRKAA